MLKPDKFGSTFVLADADSNSAGANMVFLEVVRSLRFWDLPLHIHLEYNGGLTSAYPIHNMGLSYLFLNPDHTKTLSLAASYKYIHEGAMQNTFQLAAYWNVYTASGYDASNITMIIGDDGVVLIDAGKFAHNSEEVYKEFRKITDKPITGTIYTHGHGDHTMGTPAFLKDNNPQIWAAESFGRENEFPTTAGFVNPRAHRQNGMTLSPEVRINNGVAPVVYPDGGYSEGADLEAQAKKQYVLFDKSVITNFVSEPKETITISGITLELIRTYGETHDHLVIWCPAEKIIFPGDQFYKSFPNLYAIRGTEYRDVLKWIEALDVVLEYPAEAMAQGHTRPIVGAENVK